MIDIDFTWPCDERGYSVHEVEPGKNERRTLLTKKGTYIIRKGGRLLRHNPTAFNHALYARFAALDGSPESCVEFANAFGYLGLIALGDEADGDGSGPGGESLILWRYSIKDMARAIDAQKKNPRTLFAGGRTAIKVANLTAILKPGGIDGRPVLAIQPCSLLGAMYLQLAQAVVSGASLRACDFCGNWFEVGGKGRRSIARFCSDTCRTTFHNAQKSERRKK